MVRYKVACQCKILEKEERDCLLNPNEDDLAESDLSELSDLVLDVAQLEAKTETTEDDLNLSKIQKLKTLTCMSMDEGVSSIDSAGV